MKDKNVINDERKTDVDEIIIQHHTDDAVVINDNRHDETDNTITIIRTKMTNNQFHDNTNNKNDDITTPNYHMEQQQHDDEEDEETNMKMKKKYIYNSWYYWIHDQFMKQIMNTITSSSSPQSTTTSSTTTTPTDDGTIKIFLLLLLTKMKNISNSISLKKKMTTMIASIMIGLIVSSYHYSNNNNNNNKKIKHKQQLISNQQKKSLLLLSLYQSLITKSSSLYVILYQVLFNRNTTMKTKSLSSYKNATIVPVSLLLQSIKNHYIQQILLGSNGIIYFQTKTNSIETSSSLWKRTVLPKENAILLQKDIIQQLTTNSKHHVDITVLPESVFQTDRIISILLSSLPFLYLYFLYRFMKTTTSGINDDLFGISKLFQKSTKEKNDNLNNNNITFHDIGGLDNIIVEVNEIVLYIKDPTRYINIGATVPKGILLYGPPGVGKTLIVNAIANESNVDCFISCSASDFVDIYVGRGASRIRSIFNTAYQQAISNGKQRRNSNNKKKNHFHNILSKYIPSMPSFISLSSSSGNQQSRDDDGNNRPYSAIIFIDELDALAKTRCGGLGGGSNDERDQTLNQLLTEMDGFHSKTHNEVVIIVIAASNRVDTLDPAIIRRFDRQIYIGYPNVNERKAILQIHSKYITLEPSLINNNNKSNTLWDDISVRTNEFTGCDLRNVINEAALLAVRDNISPYVTRIHINHALQKIKQMKHNIVQQKQNQQQQSSVFLFPSSSS